MKMIFSSLLLLTLGACAGRQSVAPTPIVVPQPVAVAVDSPCVPDTLGGQPIYVDTDDALKKADDAAERYQLLWAGRGQRISRLNEIEPIIAACPRGTVAKSKKK